jgi:UDP-N-acetylglucosamine transferase subunit ALG13
MIFVTVGTHEQPFDRLIQKVDELKKHGQIPDDVFMQTGYSTYVPFCCEYRAMIEFQEMESRMKTARIVITHGGPCSIIQARFHGKKPIVVPRQKMFKEHVDDHQVRFTNFLESKAKIIAGYNIDTLTKGIKERDRNRLSVHKQHANHIDLQEKANRFGMVVEDLIDRLVQRNQRSSGV